MKDLNRFLLLGLVLMLIAGCSKTEIEPDPLVPGNETALKGAKVQMVPLKSAFETWLVSEEYIFSGETPIGLHVVVEGSGNANHLGKTTLTVDQEWYFPMTPGPLTGESVLTMTAANGDILTFDFEGIMIINQSIGKIDISGTCEITGGTGRFEDASSDLLDLAASFDRVAGAGDTFITGSIMY